MDHAALVEMVVRMVSEQVKNISEPRRGQSEIPSPKQEDILIPVGISNRHVHLSREHVDLLFGGGDRLEKLKDLSQPGQFVCRETVTLVGPKGVMEKVRVLGPVRNYTQVEISVSDCFKLGIKAPIRDSGDLTGSAGITLVGAVGSVTIPEGCIIANRHIHMNTGDASRLGLKHGDRVSVKAPGPRGVTYAEVLVRVSDHYRLEIHLDIDEANAVGLKNQDLVRLCI